MQSITNLTRLPHTLINRHKDKIVTVFFWYFLISFLADQIFNHFFYFPFFVISALIILPILFFIVQLDHPERRQLYVLFFSFLIIVITNSIVFVFGVKNISDFLFIVLFITSYYFYKNNLDNLSVLNVFPFLVVCVLLFSFTFLGVDSYKSKKTNTQIDNSDHVNRNEVDEESIINYSPKVNENTKYTNINGTPSEWKPKPVHLLKKLRVFHRGLFRITHVAAYFFGFLFLFFAYQYRSRKRMIDIVLLIISLLLCLYTGSKTALLAMALSIFIFILVKRSIFYSALLILIFVVLIYERESILRITENTIIYPYTLFIYISSEKIGDLSRFQIWNSWWTEISHFGYREFLIGKSFSNVLVANEKNLNLRIWFHNDFLNIFYTYGIIGVFLYIWFFIKIFRDYRLIINNNIIIFVFYFSMVITAFINGYYYYFPVFILYLFFLMIKNEQKIQEIV